MANSKNTPNDDLPPEPSAKSHFSKAVEEAKAGAQALGKEAQGRAEDYRDKLSHTTEDLSSKGREKSGEAKDKAYEYADQGKAKASEAISGLGKKVRRTQPSSTRRLAFNTAITPDLRPLRFRMQPQSSMTNRSRNWVMTPRNSCVKSLHLPSDLPQQPDICWPACSAAAKPFFRQ